MSDTATQIMQSETRVAMASGMDRLFHNLRRFLRAYARTEEQQKTLPDLDIVFAVGVDDSPEDAVLDAIRTCPEMWASAVPPECCIVSRKTLQRIVGESATAALAMEGDAMVRTAASLHQRPRDRDYPTRSPS
jgi:hypothetical protein